MENNKQLMGLINEISEDVKSFIYSYVDSFIKWDLVKLLYKNKKSYNTLEDVSRLLGRDKDMIITEINDLVSKGIILTEKKDKTVYTYTSDKSINEQTKKFLEFCSQREARLKVIFLILKEKRK